MNVFNKIITGLMIVIFFVYLCGTAIVMLILHPLYAAYYKRKNKKVIRL